jgi:hypothetical protein
MTAFVRLQIRHRTQLRMKWALSLAKRVLARILVSSKARARITRRGQRLRINRIFRRDKLL